MPQRRLTTTRSRLIGVSGACKTDSAPGTVPAVCTVDWDKVIAAVSAVGTVAAAVTAIVAAYIALKIARDARADARRESDDRHEAQARLVRLSFEGVREQRAFAVVVTNWGDLAILNVALVAASFVDTFRPTAEPAQPLMQARSEPLDVVVPVSREALAQPRLMVDFRVADRSVLDRDEEVGHDPLFSDNTTVHATIEFTDAYGLHWQQSSDGQPRRLPRRSARTLHAAA